MMSGQNPQCYKDPDTVMPLLCSIALQHPLASALIAGRGLAALSHALDIANKADDNDHKTSSAWIQTSGHVHLLLQAGCAKLTISCRCFARFILVSTLVRSGMY